MPVFRPCVRPRYRFYRYQTDTIHFNSIPSRCTAGGSGADFRRRIQKASYRHTPCVSDKIPTAISLCILRNFQKKREHPFPHCVFQQVRHTVPHHLSVTAEQADAGVNLFLPAFYQPEQEPCAGPAITAVRQRRFSAGECEHLRLFRNGAPAPVAFMRKITSLTSPSIFAGNAFIRICIPPLFSLIFLNILTLFPSLPPAHTVYQSFPAQSRKKSCALSPECATFLQFQPLAY